MSTAFPLPEVLVPLKKKWDLACLSTMDCHDMQVFIDLFEDFFQRCEGCSGSAVGILSSHPPLKKVNDKFVLGLYKEKNLIGLLDIIRNYPEQGTWTIGYLLIHPDYQSQGIGSKLICDLRLAITPARLRCIVQNQNPRALAFWQSNGFTITQAKEDKDGQGYDVLYG